MTIQYLHSTYQVHRAKTEHGTQELVTTGRGPGYCLSKAGLDHSQVRKQPPDRDHYIIMEPIMAVKEKVPVKTSELPLPKENTQGEDHNEVDLLGTRTLTSIDKTDIVLYNTYSGQWSRDLTEIKSNYPWLTATLPNLSQQSIPGFYFLGRKSDNSYQWISADEEVQVLCSTNRGLYGIREELIDISSQLSGILGFFDKARSEPKDTDTQIGPNLFNCRPGWKTDQFSRVLLLALHDAMTELLQNQMSCTPVMSQLFDALALLSTNMKSRKKDRNDQIKSSLTRDKRDIFSLLGPSQDYGPIYDTLVKLRDNLIFNHQILSNHGLRMESLEKETLTDLEHAQLLGTLHNCDVYSRDINKASFRNLDNLRYVNTVIGEALETLQDEAVLLANSVHYDASCFSHKFHGIQCAKDVPRVQLSSEGFLIIEYFSEEIVLQEQSFYTCLPTRYGLSRKNRHYSVQKAGSTILLNNGALITNETDPESFVQDYEKDLATIEGCFFNSRQDDHVYLNCKEETTLQYSSSKGVTEAAVIKPFQLFRAESSSFPINIRGATINLGDIQREHDNVLLQEMYGRVAREAWISALHLPSAIVQCRDRVRKNEYWSDVGRLSVKYPKLRYYFSISLAVMSLTGAGLIGTCLMKYRINILSCCMYMYKCCQPKEPGDLPPSRFRQTNYQTENERPKEKKSRKGARKPAKRRRSGSRTRDRTRSRSTGRTRSRSTGRRRSRSPAPSYSAATAPLTAESSTQVRDRYSVAYKK